MGTYTGESGYLAECLQMFGVFGRGEGCPIVTVILLRYHTKIMTLVSHRLVLWSGSHHCKRDQP